MPAKSMDPPATPTTDTSIKRLLRHRSSRQYYKDGGWTQNPEEAKSFADVVEVAQTCAQQGLSDVELALRYGSSKSDVFCTPIR